MLAAERTFARQALSSALALVDRYSLDITRIAGETLGPDGVANRDVRLLLTIQQTPRLTPSALADRLGISRSLVSQSLRRFRLSALITHEVDPADRRSSRVSLTAKGRQRVAAFEARLGDWFVAASPQVREALALLRHAPPAESVADVAATPLEVAERLGAAGSPFVTEVSALLLQHGITQAIDRFAVSLIDHQAPLRPAHLAKQLHLTTSGVSTLLDRLEGAALIERDHHPDVGDRRAVMVSLTVAGRTVAATTLDVFERHAATLCEALALTLKTPPAAQRPPSSRSGQAVTQLRSPA